MSEGKLWKPCAVMQKVWSYPALGVMMGARNWAAPTHAIIQMLQSGALVPQTIEELAAICAPVLADGARSSPLPFAAYLFGWSFKRDRAVGYAFYSEDGCLAEPLPDGYGIYPEHPGGDLSDCQGWFDVTRRQQEMDQAREFGERDHLGGRIIVHELRRPHPGEGPAIIARCVGTLSGSEGLIEQANARLAGMLEAHGVTPPEVTA